MPRKKSNKPRNERKAQTSLRTRTRRLKPFALQVILKAIETGHHFSVACQAAHLRYDDFMDMLDKGRRGDIHYQEFARQVEAAEHRAEELALAVIREAATGLECTTITQDDEGNVTTEVQRSKDWKAAAFLLERRWAARWGALRKMQHSGVLTQRQHVIIHDDEDDMLQGNRVIEDARTEEEVAEEG